MGELILQTIAIALATVNLIYFVLRIILQVRSSRSRPRSPSALKTAIEIYKMLDESDSKPHRATVKAYIDETISHIYQPPTQTVQPATKEELAADLESQPFSEFPLFNPTRLPNSIWEYHWYWRIIPF